MLIVEAVMRDRDYGALGLSNLYKEYPYRVFRAPVVNRLNFRCNWDETELVEPKRLQDIIEVFAKDKEGGRAHIRPAAAEDVLLVYVEAKHASDVETIANILLDEIEMRFKNHGVS